MRVEEFLFSWMDVQESEFACNHIYTNTTIEEIDHCTYRITIKDIYRHGLEAVKFWITDDNYINGLSSNPILISLVPFVFIVHPD